MKKKTFSNGDQENDPKQTIKFLIDECNNYKTTINNLNFLINVLLNELETIKQKEDWLIAESSKKIDILKNFLNKHGLSIEDLIEFENEHKFED